MRLMGKCLIAMPVLLAGVMASSSAWSAGGIGPIEYPYGTIGNSRPAFIWQDLYSARDRGVNVKYRLTVRRKGEAAARNWLVTPALHHASYYTFAAPEMLAEGEYGFTIERILDGAPDGSRMYHYRRYPVRGEFTLSPPERRDFESLDTALLIRYLTLERDNRFANGYNALFFTGSATITLGVGILFYSVIDLGWVSTVIYAVCFASSGIGYGAAGYYGWNYYDGRRELGKIVDEGRRASLNGGHAGGPFAVSLKFHF